ncbi:MAG: hypothetical protein IJS01_06860 [Lentisphaeria bacterium]|nr:hypothetical protein [Lentisphaeria bacterium]
MKRDGKRVSLFRTVLGAVVMTGVLQAAEKAKPDLWLDHKFAVLPGASSKGFDRKAAYALSNRGIEKLRLPEKRPVPTADFLLKDTPGRAGSVTYKKVPVELLEEAGVARRALIRFGFPLPEGGLFDLAHLRLGDGEKEIPASYSVTGKYPDGSLRWVMIRAAVPLAAREKKTLFVEFGSKLAPRKAEAEAIRISEDENFIAVDNGVLSARINKKRFTLIQDVRLGKTYCGSVNGFGTLMVFRDGKRFGTYKTPPSIRCIESTPAHVVYRIDGVFGEAADPYGSYTARLSFHRGVPGFDLEYTHINTNMRYEFTDIRSMTVGFATGKANPLKSWAHFTGGTPVPGGAERVVQLDDATVSADGKTFPARLPGGIKFVTEKGVEGTITVSDAWKRYPKGFAVDPRTNTVNIELLPELPDEKFGKHLPYYLQFPFCGGGHRIKWGVSFTERLSFRFGKDLSPEAAAAEANLPVIATLPPAWYAEAGIWKGMALEKLYAGIDKEALDLFKRNLQRREKQREYGAFSYGDSFGERAGQNWTNNEYDMPHGMFLLGLRTGDREVLRYALAAARHEADVDIVHAYLHPYFVGCNIQHSCAHTGTYGRWSWPYRCRFNDGYSGHNWLRGMVDSWHLFGEGTAMDSSYLLADHLAFAWLPALTKLVQIRDGAWNLIALCEIARSSGRPEYRKAADALAKYLMELVDLKTEWYMNRTGGGRGGIAVFMCGILLNSLCDYHDLTGRADAAAKCGDFGRWLVKKTFSPDLGGLFWYDVTPAGRSTFPSAIYNALIAPGVIRAGAIARDRELFLAGLNAFKALSMCPVDASGKSVALHLLFIEDVLQAAASWRAKDTADVPETFDRDVWRRDLARLQTGSVMHRGSARYVIVSRLDGQSADIQWSNYNGWNAKPVIKKLLVTDQAGKAVLKYENLPTEIGKLVKHFPLQLGPAGSRYTVEIETDGRSMWVISGTPGCDIFHDMSAGAVTLVSAVTGRYTLEQLPGETIKIRLAPMHNGRFGLTVRDDRGKVLFTKSGEKLVTDMKDTGIGIDCEIPAVGEKRTLALELFAGNCAMLKVAPGKLLARPRPFPALGVCL